MCAAQEADGNSTTPISVFEGLPTDPGPQIFGALASSSLPSSISIWTWVQMRPPACLELCRAHAAVS